MTIPEAALVHLSLARTVLLVVLSAAGVLNLIWMLRRLRSPAEMRGFLLAAGAFLLVAVAVWAQGARHTAAAVGSGALAAVCAIAWFYHIYIQSLHNTTM